MLNDCELECSEIYLFLFFTVLVVLRFEFSAPYLLGKCSKVLYHLSHASSPFCFSYFSDRVFHFCLRLASDLNLTYTSQ
jgi:hypothetical protein